jgi:hypothetical protein
VRLGHGGDKGRSEHECGGPGVASGRTNGCGRCVSALLAPVTLRVAVEQAITARYRVEIHPNDVRARFALFMQMTMLEI